MTVFPPTLQFTVSITNTLNHVFRGAGVFVRFSVAGTDVKVDSAGWSKLAGLIIAPRGTEQVLIYGPKIETLPDTGVIGLFFDDVVTNSDAAGNVTERQSFEWYFQYSVHLKEDERPVFGPDRLWVGPTRQMPACPSGT